MTLPLTRTDTIRKSLWTAKQNHSHAAIAAALNCSRQTLTKFLKGGGIGNNTLERAEKWTTENGFWLGDKQRLDMVREDNGTYATNPRDLIAGLLNQISLTLVDPAVSDRFALQQLGFTLKNILKEFRSTIDPSDKSPNGYS